MVPRGLPSRPPGPTALLGASRGGRMPQPGWGATGALVGQHRSLDCWEVDIFLDTIDGYLVGGLEHFL